MDNLPMLLGLLLCRVTPQIDVSVSRLMLNPLGPTTLAHRWVEWFAVLDRPQTMTASKLLLRFQGSMPLRRDYPHRCHKVLHDSLNGIVNSQKRQSNFEVHVRPLALAVLYQMPLIERGVERFVAAVECR